MKRISEHYIERDVRLMMGISDLRQFSRFNALFAAITAQEINYSELGRDLGIDSKTTKFWLDLMVAS